MNLTIQSYDCYNNNNRNISFQRIDKGVTKLVKDSGNLKIDECVNKCTESGVKVSEKAIMDILDFANSIHKRLHKIAKKFHKDIVLKRIKDTNGENTFILTHEKGEPIKFSEYTHEPEYAGSCSARDIELEQYHTIYHFADVTPDIPSLENLEHLTSALESTNPELINKTMLSSMINRARNMVKTNTNPEVLNEQLNAIYKFGKETGLEEGLQSKVEFALENANKYRQPAKDIDPKLAKINEEIAHRLTHNWRIGTTPKNK